MPLPPTGEISFEQIRAEFGGTGQVSLNSYYKGGARVPDDAFCHNNTIPANGTISFDNFRATTNGLSYYSKYSGSENWVPTNKNIVRVQTIMRGGGGGGCGRNARTIFGTFLIRYRASSAGGGGGGYGVNTLSLLANQGEYLSITVGSGGNGAGAFASAWNTLAAADGQSSITIRRNSAGTELARSTIAGGTGGSVRYRSINNGNDEALEAIAGTNGGGGSTNGGANNASRDNNANVSSSAVGGTRGGIGAYTILTATGGNGGSASGSYTGGMFGNGGIGGEVHIRY